MRGFLHDAAVGCVVIAVELPMSSVDKKNQLDVTFFVFFISLLIVPQHVSGNRVPFIRS
jgi:hypothetical protein